MTEAKTGAKERPGSSRNPISRPTGRCAVFKPPLDVQEGHLHVYFLM